MTTAEAAAWLADRGLVLRPDTIKHHILRHHLPATRTGSLRRGAWHISEADLAAFLATYRGPGWVKGRPRRKI
jgi:hypothetical protein